MLSKSIKHEFRATSRIMLPMILALLAISIVTHFAPMILELGTAHWLLKTAAVLFFIIFFVGIMAVAIGTLVIACKRFYQSFFSDEGYLNMTLPTTAHTHIASRVIVVFIWDVFAAIAIVLSLMVVFLDMQGWNQLFTGFTDLFPAIQLALQKLEAGQLWTVIGIALEIFLGMILSQVLGTLLIYASIAIGYSFNKGKKSWAILFAFIFYFGLQFVSMIYTVGMTATQVLPDLTDSFSKIPMAMLLLLVPELLACVAFYLITYFFMTRKLNLE